MPASPPSSVVRFREVRREARTWIRVLVALAAVLAWGGLLVALVSSHLSIHPWGVIRFVLFGVWLPAAVLIASARIEVHDDALWLRWRFQRRVIPLASITRATSASCYPGLDAGAWGVTGPTGVRLWLTDGEVLQLATARPRELLEALGATSDTAATSATSDTGAARSKPSERLPQPHR